MAERLVIGEPITAYTDLNCTVKAMGFIRYIGLIEQCGMKQHVGIELIQPIENGHNGTIHGVQYFDTEQGFGIHIPIRNVIKSLTASEALLALKSTLHIFRQTTSEYMDTIQHQEDQIKSLRDTEIQLKSIISSATSSTSTLQFKPNSKPQISIKIAEKKSIIRHTRHQNNTPNFLQQMAMKVSSDARNTFFLPTPITPMSVGGFTPKTIATPDNSNPSSPTLPGPSLLQRMPSNISTVVSVQTPFSPIRESPTNQSPYSTYTVAQIDIPSDCEDEDSASSFSDISETCTPVPLPLDDDDEEEEQDYVKTRNDRHRIRHIPPRRQSRNRICDEDNTDYVNVRSNIPLNIGFEALEDRMNGEWMNALAMKKLVLFKKPVVEIRRNKR
eukprot:102754_1